MRPAAVYAPHDAPSVPIWPLAVLFVLALVAYTLPWIAGSGVGLTFGGYDLAEWTSLHPAVHAQTPPFLTTLLLRLPAACAALALVFAGCQDMSRPRRWLLGAVTVLTAVALLPPFEILTVAREDPNYRQQALLAAVTLVAGLIGASGWARRAGRWIGLALAVLAGAAAVAGLALGYELLAAFKLSVRLGVGGPLFVVLCALMALWLGLNDRRGSLL